MKKGWKIVSLGEVCDKASSNISQNQLDTEVGEFPIYGASGFIKNISFYHRNSPYLSIVKDGSGVGRVTKMPAFSSVIGTLQYIMPNESVDLDYLNYYLMSVDFKKYIAGAAIPHIYFKDYKNEPFLWIPLQEQKQIVSILDDAFALIDNAKANIECNLQNAKNLFQSKLNNIFTKRDEGWTERKLADIAIEFGRGKSKHRPRNHESLYGGKYPFIQTGDVRNSDKLITQYSQTYNEIGLAQSKLWKKGTICITIAANIAETGILTFDSCFPDSMIGLVVDPKKAEVNFAYYALQFLKAKLQLLGKGSAQDNINMGTFEEQTFPFPSIEIQRKIVSELDSLSLETKSIENMYRQKLNMLEDLKKSILSKAFKGELTNKELAI